MAVKTIDLTPTWGALLPALVEVAANGETAEGKKVAMEELERMASISDAQKLPHGWAVSMVVDDDKHLSIYVRNADGIPVEIDEDLDSGDEVGFRFTTEKIEGDYIDS